MKVLVTGGSGFLGTGVVAGLAAAGAVAGHDAVVHLASVVDPDGMGRDAAYRVDVDGSRHVIDACVDHGVRRLVVSSSGAAYGYHADNPVPITEEWRVRGTTAFAYSHHKALVEHLLADARRDHP